MADLMRWGFPLVCAPLLSGFVFVVMQEARKFRAPAPHVWLVATSYLVFLWGWAFEALSNLGEPATWRLPLAYAAWLLGMSSQFVMYRHYKLAKRRLRHARRSLDAPVVKQAESLRKEEE